MTCTNEYTLVFKKKKWRKYRGKKFGSRCITVGCGKCMACRINKMTDWSDRLIHELEDWDTACYVTLTYDDEHLPIIKSPMTGLDIPTLKKRDAQLWIKKLRFHHPKKLKYYIAGEYGKLERPHYHGIIYGMSINECKTLGNRLWRMSSPVQFHVDVAIPQTIRYTCKYMMKALGQTYTFREKPFIIMSQGMGKNWCIRNKNMLLKNLSIISDNGAVHPIPRYYRKILGITPQMLPEPADYDKYDAKRRPNDCKQREKNLIAKLKLKENKL